MSSENSTHDSVFTAYAFLAGATLTSLFFLIQTNSKNEFVISTLGVACILFIITTIARLNITNKIIGRNTKFSKAVGWMAVIGLILLLVSLIIIIMIVSVLAGIISGTVLIISWITLDRLAKRENSSIS